MSLQKFGRSYRLTIDPNDGGDPIVVIMPITVDFTINRNTQASLNYFVIDIKNLAEKTRDRIFQDRFVSLGRQVTFEAGYDQLTTIFKGYIFYANSYRQGPDIVTSIEARDGSFDVSTTMTFETFAEGKTLNDLFKFLTGQFPNLEFGNSGSFTEKFGRPVTLNGNTYDLLKKYSDNQVFVDLGKVYVLKPNEALADDIVKLSVGSGLLEGLRRDESYLSVPVLFEPRIQVGRFVELESVINPKFDGQYKAIGILHQGTISGAVNGRCRTTVSLLSGTQTFGEFQKVG